MPQMGQFAGWSVTTLGCIGQTYCGFAATALAPAAGVAWPACSPEPEAVPAPAPVAPPAPAAGFWRTSFIPQMGQLEGRSEVTVGCMGQT